MPSTLTEKEVFDVITTNLRDAAENCELLAKLPAKGPTYIKLRENLQLIEGGCRQIVEFRRDMRYDLLGMRARDCHQRAGDWLRSVSAPILFFKLATALRKIRHDMERLRNARTGRRGPILPAVGRGKHRETRPVYIRRPSGLVMPA